jgi:hypothetical protein
VVKPYGVDIMQESSSTEMRELTPSELACVAGGVAFAGPALALTALSTGGTISAAVTLATGPSVVAVFFGGDGTYVVAALLAGAVLNIGIPSG